MKRLTSERGDDGVLQFLGQHGVPDGFGPLPFLLLDAAFFVHFLLQRYHFCDWRGDYEKTFAFISQLLESRYVLHFHFQIDDESHAQKTRAFQSVSLDPSHFPVTCNSHPKRKARAERRSSDHM